MRNAVGDLKRIGERTSNLDYSFKNLGLQFLWKNFILN